MSDGERDEKELRKQEEKGGDEKMEEKWSRDRLSAITWAGILIWAGFVLLASNLGLFEQVLGIVAKEPADLISDFNVWSLVFAGAGLILLGEAVIRLLLPEYRGPITGNIILGLVFLSIGLGNLIDWSIIFAIVLIVLGIGALIRAVRSD